MKYSTKHNSFVCRCKKCKQTHYYTSRQFAEKNSPLCLTCRKGIQPVYFSKKGYNCPCPKCHQPRYYDTREMAYDAARHVDRVCQKCKGEKISEIVTKWTPERMAAVGISCDGASGIWTGTCPSGHKRTCKTFYAACQTYNNPLRFCPQCSKEAQQKKNQSTFIQRLEGEEWRPIKGYEHYQVSNLGRVKNEYDKILRPQVTSQCKYHSVSLYDGNGGHEWFGVHRLVAKAFIPNPQSFCEVDHLNHNKQDNNVTNLRWCTHKENIRAARDAGRYVGVSRWPKYPKKGTV